MNQISPLAYIHPEAKIGDGNIIGPFCYIDKNTVIGDNNTFQNSVTINYGARIGNNNEFFPGASISTKPQDLKFKGEDTICIVGDNNSCWKAEDTESVHCPDVHRKSKSDRICSKCFPHNSLRCWSCLLAGSSSNAIISATVLCHQFCRIGGYVMIQGGSRTSQDIPPYIIAGKEPIRYAGVNLIGLRRRGFDNELIQLIHEAYRLLYSKGVLAEGIEEIKQNLKITPEIQYIIDFVSTSKRGIIR